MLENHAFASCMQEIVAYVISFMFCYSFFFGFINSFVKNLSSWAWTIPTYVSCCLCFLDVLMMYLFQELKFDYDSKLFQTNSSKRRKAEFDSDAPTIESESEKASSRVSKEEDNGVESHREDVPKGKRNARKRRRLELRGTSTEESRKRGSRSAISVCYTSAFSHSNEGNELLSEDENQGAGTHNGGTKTSGSSSDDSS